LPRLSGTGADEIPARPRSGGRSSRERSALRALRALLIELAAAKHRLFEASRALRAVERRLRAPSWDAREPFMARRGRTLCDESTAGFARALDALNALLVRVTARMQADRVFAPGEARSPGTRRLLVEIRQELRYLQRAFDGGSLLLATALERFGGG